MLAIEIDGDSHETKKYQIKTVRYTNDQVFNELENIKNDLKNIIIEREKLVFGPPFVKGGHWA